MDNTVGSLSQVQMSVVIGSLLGDGYVRKIKNRSNAFLEVNHSLSQKEYVDWKYEVLKPFVGGVPKTRKGNGERVAYRFYSKQHPTFSELRNKFYKDGRKIIPDIQLDPISLAVWYMDDGSKCRSSDVYLNTQQFDYSSQLTLIGMLNKLGLQANLNKDKHYFRIRFLKSSLGNFKNLVDNFIISSMRYKLDI